MFCTVHMSGTTHQAARHVRDLWTGRQTPRVRDQTLNQLGKAYWTLICALAAQGDYSWYGLSAASHIAMTWFCLSLHDKDISSGIISTNTRRNFTNLLSILFLANDAISVAVWAVVNQDSSLFITVSFLTSSPLKSTWCVLWRLLQWSLAWVKSQTRSRSVLHLGASLFSSHTLCEQPVPPLFLGVFLCQM